MVLRHWQTENVTDMSYIFYGCSSLSSLEGMSNWQIGNAKDIKYMFYGCSSLLSLNGLSN